MAASADTDSLDAEAALTPTAIRLLMAAGVLYPVLAISRVFVSGEAGQPPWTADRGDIVAFYGSVPFDTTFMMSMTTVAAAYLLLLVFTAGLVELFGARAPRTRWTGRALMSVTVVLVTSTFVYIAAYSTATFWASHGGLTADAYLTLHGFQFAIYWIGLVADAGSLTLLGLLILSTRLFPRWLGHALILNAIAELVALPISTDAWTAVSGIPYLLILATAIYLPRAARSGLAARPGSGS